VNLAALSVAAGNFHPPFGADPIPTAIHAGMETSFIGVPHAKMDTISVSPPLVGVHKPVEPVQMASVHELDDWLTEALKWMSADLCKK
jgi:dipeptidase D